MQSLTVLLECQQKHVRTLFLRASVVRRTSSVCVQAFNVSVKALQGSSFMGGLGRLLDKGINRLISGDLPPSSGPPSNGSDADPFGRQQSKNLEPGSPSVRPS